VKFSEEFFSMTLKISIVCFVGIDFYHCSKWT